MKRVLVCVALAAGVATADDESPFLKDAALAAEVARNCSDGCVVLSPAEAAALTLSVQAMVDERAAAAFQEGFRQGSKSCRNAI